MKRNKFLSYSLKFFTIIQAIPIIGFIAFTLFLGSYLLDPEALNNFSFSEGSKIEWVSDTEAALIKNGVSNEMLIRDIEPFVIYIMYLKGIIALVCTWFILQEFKKVIKASLQRQTFRVSNVESFRKMGKYFLVLFLLTSFTFYVVGYKGEFTLDMDLKFAMLAVASFILAEVFKEGSQLQEEHQLTV